MKTPKVKSQAKWDLFVSQLKEDRKDLKNIIQKGSEDMAKSNVEYSKCKQRSFNSIHSIKRKSMIDIERVPRIKKPISPKKVSSSFSSPIKPIEYETPVTNTYIWPKRDTSAKRVYSPTKLSNYPSMERHQDIAVMHGAIVKEPTLL